MATFRHPSELTEKEWKSYKKMVRVEVGDKSAFCIRVGSSFFHVNIYTKEVGEFFCTVEEPTSVRGLSGFDF